MTQLLYAFLLGNIASLVLLSQATNVECDSMFFALKRLRTYLRSMGYNRLHALMFVHVHKNIKKINKSTVENSTLFPRTFFDVILLIEKPIMFLRTFFDVISMVEKSTLFPYTFFDVISLIEKSILFLRTFFDVISMVQKSILFPRNFLM